MHSRYIRALLAIIFVTSVAGASFYISAKISTNKSVSPNSPESKAKAYDPDAKLTSNPKKVSTSTPTKAKVTPKKTNTPDEDLENLASANSKKKIIPTQTPSPTQLVTATPTPQAGGFGYRPTADEKTKGPSYMSDENNKCDDGLGFISGTGCFNGQRRVLNIPATQQAYQQHVQAVQEELATMTNEELLKKANISCNPAKKDCQEELKKAQAIVLASSVILEKEEIEYITKVRLQNQALNDIASANSSTYLTNTYGSSNPKTILNTLGIDSTLAQKAIDQGKLVAAAAAKALADAAALKAATDAKKELDAKLPALINSFIDPTKSDAVLAKEYCKGKTDIEHCESYFKRSDVLTGLDTNSQEYKNALANRQASLANLIPLVVGSTTNSSIKLDTKTKQEIIKLNEDTTHAFWVYVRDNAARQHQGVTSDQLAKEFNDKLAKDPTLLNKNIATYNSQPKAYNMYGSNYQFSKEENPLIVSKYNEIIKTTPIAGLSENGKPLAWDKVSPEYKKLAVDKACENDPKLYDACSFVKLNEGNPNTTENYKKYLAQIDAAAKSNSSVYLQAVINDKTGNGVQLSTFGSNIVDINNMNVGNAEINKAKTYADSQEFKDNFFNPKYGFGNMSGSAIVPKSVSETLPDPTTWTKEQKDLVATQYLAEQKVIETYTRGAGVAGAIGAATLASALCAELGPAAIACGAVAGLAAAVTNYIPILGSSTAQEIAAEQQKIKDVEIFGYKPFNSDTAAGLVQSLYSSQGAACDTVDGIKIGASCTTKNNPFALLANIQTENQNNSTTLSALEDPTTKANIAIQPFLNQQFDALQNENQTQAYINIAIAPVMGAISAGVGANIANAAPKNIISNFLVNQSASLGNSLIGAIQANYQFNSTVNFVDSQSEKDLALCTNQYGAGASQCQALQTKVNTENTEAAKNNMIMAVVSDQILDKVITIGAFTTETAGKLISQNPTAKTSSGISQTIDPNDSTFLSPALARELNNLDPRILINSSNGLTAEENINLAQIGMSTNSRSGNVINTPADITVGDVILAAESLAINQTQGTLTPQEANIIASVHDIQISRKTDVEVITGISREQLSGLSELQQHDLNNLAKIVSDPKTSAADKELFTQVLKSQTDRYLNNNKNISTATPVKTSTSDIQTLAESSGIHPDYLNLLTEPEIAILRPQIDELNNPNITPQRKSELTTEINNIIGEFNSLSPNARALLASTPAIETPIIPPEIDLTSQLTPQLANETDIMTAGYGQKYFLGLSEAVEVADAFNQQGQFNGPNVKPLNSAVDGVSSDVFVFSYKNKDYIIKRPKTDAIMDVYGNYNQRSIAGDTVAEKIPNINFANTHGLQLDDGTQIFIQNRVQGVSPTIAEFDKNILPNLLRAQNENGVYIQDVKNPNNWIKDQSGEYHLIDTEGVFHGINDKQRAMEVITGIDMELAPNPQDNIDIFAEYKDRDTKPKVSTIDLNPDSPSNIIVLGKKEPIDLTINPVETVSAPKTSKRPNLLVENIKSLIPSENASGLKIVVYPQKVRESTIGVIETIRSNILDRLPNIGTDLPTAAYLYELNELKSKAKITMSEALKNDPTTNTLPLAEEFGRQAQTLANNHGIEINDNFEPVGYSALSLTLQKIENYFRKPIDLSLSTTGPLSLTVSMSTKKTTLSIPKNGTISTDIIYPHEQRVAPTKVTPSSSIKRYLKYLLGIINKLQ